MFRIAEIGIRSGDLITNSPKATQNKGTIIKVRSSNGISLAYPPSESWINNLDETAVRDLLNQYPFFSKMSFEERKKWLNDNSTKNNDLYMEDTNIEVKFIEIKGKFMVTALTEIQINSLLKGNPNNDDGWWPIREVYNMFPRKPNSKAKKHTLIFRPSNWVVIPESTDSDIDKIQIYLDLDTLSLHTPQQKPIPNNKCYLRTFKLTYDNSQLTVIGIVTSQVRSTPLTWDSLINLAGNYRKEMELIKPIIEWFPPALHKSLIQKLIRTRCEQVKHNEKLYSSGSVLLTSISLLILSPGSFVPNIQRFVSGLEAIKRLAVSICEDSWIEDSRVLLAIYGAALIAQQDRTWKPTDQLIELWFRIAITAQQSPFIYDYDHKNYINHPVQLYTPLHFCHVLLSELRSFESDINMLGSIADNNGKNRIISDDYKLPEYFKIMPLIHCVDHHTYTEIAHKREYDGISYDIVFKNIWNFCVGVNPRLTKYNNWNPNDLAVIDIRKAQRLIWINKCYTPQPLSYASDKDIIFTYELDEQWLAGLVGQISVRVGHTDAIVVLTCENTLNGGMTAIKRQSRDIKVRAELTEEEKILAINQAIDILRRGYVLKHVPDTLPELKNAIIYYRGDINSPIDPVHYDIKLSSGLIQSWNDFSKMTYKFPIMPTVNPTVEHALLYTGDGITSNANEIFEYLIIKTPRNVLTRLITYLEGNHSNIKLFKIGRDGAGTEYTVLPEDTGVDILLCYICCLYPAALVSTDNGYIVKCGPLLWSLRDRIVKSISRIMNNNNFIWNIPNESNRKLWEHQKDSVENMIRKHENGRKGHEIWINVGMGKTSIVLEYLIYLIRKKEMVDYCVYTAPPSSIDNLIKELQAYNLPYIQIDMRKNGKNQILQQGVVNIIFHDHMRLMSDQLKSNASNMLFIVDEFHKTMNKTIRTSVALEVVRLSWDFVALSGTIIKGTGDGLEELYEWLEQIVEFEINNNNYMVAIGALISKKVNTHVVVERYEIDAKLIDDKKYYSYVPKTLGGTSDRMNFAGALKESYASTLNELINQAFGYIKLGEKVFIAVRDSNRQNIVASKLNSLGVQHIHLINSSNPITLTPNISNNIQAVITTKQHVEGYTLTDRRIGIYEVFLANQSVYEQLDGRMNRIGQYSSFIRIITIHSGILSYIYKRYQKAHTLAEALRGFAQDIDLDVVTILQEGI